ncbi:MAG: DedA family protein [Patescibacteria group bacterium]
MDFAVFIFDVVLAYFSYPLFFTLFIAGIFVPIVPEQLLLLLAGYLSYSGFANYFFVIMIALCGTLIGDIATYWFGKRWGRWAIHTVATRYKFISKMFRLGEKIFNRYDAHALIIGRFIAGARVTVLILAGTFEMKWKKFIQYAFVGALLWIVITVSVGYIIGMSLDFALFFINGKKIAFFIFIIFIILYAIVYFVKRKLFKM